jgi:hypothetical protein
MSDNDDKLVDEELEYFAKFQSNDDLESLFGSPEPTEHDINDLLFHLNEIQKPKTVRTKGVTLHTSPQKQDNNNKRFVHKKIKLSHVFEKDEEKLTCKGLKMIQYAMDCIYRNEIGETLPCEEKKERYGIVQVCKIQNCSKGEISCVDTLKLLLLPLYNNKPSIERKSYKWMKKWEKDATECPKLKHLQKPLWEFLCLQNSKSFTELRLNDPEVMMFLSTLIKE